MPKPLRYTDVYEGMKDGTVEARPHGGTYSHTARVGRSSALIDCPFCRSSVEVFIWSWRGGGKRCSCGALLGLMDAFALVSHSTEPSEE